MFLISFFKKLLFKIGIGSPLTFDQQVWGAKSVIDLVEHGSQFLLAQGTNGQECYTAWLGANTKISEAIIIDSTGHATGPFPDDSKVKDCQPCQFPTKFSCAQAVEVMLKSGITEVWTTCTLKQSTGQKNPVYIFAFAEHAPVSVDAVTGKIL